MEQTIEIPVEILGVERLYLGRLQAWQYGLRFFVDIDGVEVMFERDDGGSLGHCCPRVLAERCRTEM